MKKIIVFDSDFIIANMPTMTEYIERLGKYECFVSKISIGEVSKHYSLGNITKIQSFRSDIKNYGKYGIVFQNDDNEIKNKMEEEIEKFINSIFKENIIMNHERSYHLLLKRAFEKIPPFGKSDTGFKDTLILLDIIDYIKGKKVKNMFFVTNDSDFLDCESMIEKEVYEKTLCDFKILNGKNPEKIFNYFKVDNSNETGNDVIESGSAIDVDINGIRKELNDICYNLFHFDGYDPYNGGDFVGNNFEVTSTISKKQICEFLDNLEKNINNNIFNSNVMMSDFFENPFLFTDEQEINMEFFEKLNTIYLKIKDNELYKKALLNLLYSNFISLSNYKIKSASDLPF